MWLNFTRFVSKQQERTIIIITGQKRPHCKWRIWQIWQIWKMWPFHHKFVSKQQGYTKNKTRNYPLQARNVANELTSANSSASNKVLMQRNTIRRKLKKNANLSSTLGSENDTDGLVVKSDRSTVQGPLENKARLANCLQIQLIHQVLQQATRQCKSQDNTTEISKFLTSGAHLQPVSTIPMVVKGDGSIKPTRKYAYGIRLAVKLIVLYMLHILYTEAKVIIGKRHNSTYHCKDIGKCNRMISGTQLRIYRVHVVLQK